MAGFSRGLPPLTHDMRVVHRDGSFVVHRDWSVDFDECAREMCPYEVTGWYVEHYPLPLTFSARATYTFRKDEPRARLELRLRDPLSNDPTREFTRYFSVIRVEFEDVVDDAA